MEKEIKIIEELPVKRFEEYKKLYIEAIKGEPLAFSETFEEAIKIKDEDWKNKLKEAIENKYIFVFAESNGKLVGMGTVTFHNKEKLRHNAFFSSLYVLPEFRGYGIGRQIIEKRIEILSKNKNIKNIFCEIAETQTSSIELHENLGFKIVGEFKDLFYIDGIFYSELYLQKQIR